MKKPAIWACVLSIAYISGFNLIEYHQIKPRETMNIYGAMGDQLREASLNMYLIEKKG